LQRVEVQYQGVSLEHVHRAPTVLDAVPVVELHGAQVGKQQHIGRHRAHLKGRRQCRVLQGGAL
jgi:hypothetical protein